VTEARIGALTVLNSDLSAHPTEWLRPQYQLLHGSQRKYNAYLSLAYVAGDMLYELDVFLSGSPHPEVQVLENNKVPLVRLGTISVCLSQ
jgi:hypothetical protein